MQQFLSKEQAIKRVPIVIIRQKVSRQNASEWLMLIFGQAFAFFFVSHYQFSQNFVKK
jgi:hypothetical protein